MFSKEKLIQHLPIIAVVGVFVGLFYGAYYVGMQKSSHIIVVSGEANQEKSNQVAMFNASITSTNWKKLDAVTDINKKSAAVVTAVKTFGVEDKDIKTNYFNVYQNTQWDPVAQTSKMTDWTASLTVEIKLRDVAKAGELGLLLAQLDTSNVNVPNLQLDDSQKKDNELLKLALDDARAKAEKLAVSSGRKLGRLLSVYEGAASGTVYPMFKGAEGMGGGGSGLPVNPGTSTVYKSVTATYELR